MASWQRMETMRERVPSAYLLVLYISAIMCCMALKNYSSSPMSVFSWLVICQNVGLSVNLHFDWFIYKLPSQQQLVYTYMEEKYVSKQSERSYYLSTYQLLNHFAKHFCFSLTSEAPSSLPVRERERERAASAEQLSAVMCMTKSSFLLVS